MNKKISFSLVGLIVLLIACRQTDPVKDEFHFNPTPYQLNVPSGLPSFSVPASNPMTVEGVQLGRMLFYEPLLSGNNTLSCASCHKLIYAMSDSTTKFSKGIDGIYGKKNAMPLFNLLWASKFFWNGRTSSLEEQALKPIQDVIEMHETLPNMVAELNQHAYYPALFKQAFGTSVITAELVGKAIAQFERTLLSFSSRFDLSNGGVSLTPSEYRGWQIFKGEASQHLTNPSLPPGGDCFHCHGGEGNPLFSTYEFFNNGLDSMPDSGYFSVSLNPADLGKFKAPSLRNLKYTAPYMHDGRFDSLEQVVRHYNSGVIYSSPNLDPNLKKHKTKPLLLEDQDISDLISFLNTLNDEDFTKNENFINPFK